MFNISQSFNVCASRSQLYHTGTFVLGRESSHLTRGSMAPCQGTSQGVCSLSTCLLTYLTTLILSLSLSIHVLLFPSLFFLLTSLVTVLAYAFATHSLDHLKDLSIIISSFFILILLHIFVMLLLTSILCTGSFS